MKKLLLVCLLLIALVSMASCTNNVATPTAAWAGIEVLSYDVNDANGQNLGTMSTTIRRKTEGFSSSLEGKDYPAADCRMEMLLDTTSYNITTTVLSKGLNTLAIKKIFVDKQNAENNYTAIGYREGKKLIYTLNGVEKKLTVGSSGYTDNEFLYMYLRCYAIQNVPSSISVADLAGGTVTKVSASATLSAKAIETIPYPDGAKSAICHKINISLSDSPIGKGIEVYYTPDEATYNVNGFTYNATTKKIPVLIVENDVSYVLTNMFVA